MIRSRGSALRCSLPIGIETEWQEPTDDVAILTVRRRAGLEKSGPVAAAGSTQRGISREKIYRHKISLLLGSGCRESHELRGAQDHLQPVFSLHHHFIVAASRSSEGVLVSGRSAWEMIRGRQGCAVRDGAKSTKQQKKRDDRRAIHSARLPISSRAYQSHSRIPKQRVAQGTTFQPQTSTAAVSLRSRRISHPCRRRPNRSSRQAPLRAKRKPQHHRCSTGSPTRRRATYVPTAVPISPPSKSQRILVHLQSYPSRGISLLTYPLLERLLRTLSTSPFPRPRRTKSSRKPSAGATAKPISSPRPSTPASAPKKIVSCSQESIRCATSAARVAARRWDGTISRRGSIVRSTRRASGLWRSSRGQGECVVASEGIAIPFERGGLERVELRMRV